MPLHPALRDLAFLLGRWEGEGEGGYPTVQPFRYREELCFGHDGRPFLHYRQRSWSAEDGRPMHVEAGYLRPGQPGAVELVVAHPSGVVELSEGRRTGTELELRSRAVACASTAKDVSAIARRLSVEGDRLRTTLDMAAVGLPDTPHLRSTLHRAAPAPA
ncbi:MAG: FABP family protein [Acidobacteriota bacterium]|nr:FABP family protein [Acidobacteriota bacterium]